MKTILEDSKGLQEATPYGRAREATRWTGRPHPGAAQPLVVGPAC
jgi:hypothetical protein